MGRIQVAKDNSAFERGRPLGGEESARGSVEVEDFIRQNRIDELAARQLREADKGTQEEVMARGGLDDCRNPSA
eukprot:CAMPEP_0168475760 /NCGR_PEP_ID=MMETSP0228-20121227/61529_1 /TAXON_ID=133427 /ORGANISM="Protoceratium reticulatum, Strain CCCM 535 (=CCMP 1889)" /LENGTH=73 /DNA_ID=CAMNT_0008491841 /DNA_START=1 /DNA_END=218 /DNA_ORIENTATION=+